MDGHARRLTSGFASLFGVLVYLTAAFILQQPADGWWVITLYPLLFLTTFLFLYACTLGLAYMLFQVGRVVVCLVRGESVKLDLIGIALWWLGCLMFYLGTEAGYIITV